MINVLFLILGLLIADGGKTAARAKANDGAPKQSTPATTTLIKVPGSNPHNQPQPVESGTTVKQTEPGVSQLQWTPNEGTSDTTQVQNTVVKSFTPVSSTLTVTP